MSAINTEIQIVYEESEYEFVKEIILNSQELDHETVIHFLKKLGSFEEEIKCDTSILQLFYCIDDLIYTKKNNTGIKDVYSIWEKVFEIVRPQLTAYKLYEHINKSDVKIFLSITTCKRLDLFQQTINSLLNHCLDISLVDYWYCVDDNSSMEDRIKMKKLYPWIEFYDKTESEKAHRKSMNLIYEKS